MSDDSHFALPDITKYYNTKCCEVGRGGEGGEGRTEGITISESGPMLMVSIDFTQLSIQHCAANMC